MEKKRMNKPVQSGEANIAVKVIFFFVGWLCVILGLIGAFVPILPTTPFLILAAFLFSKSSPRLHLWLTSMPYFGSAIIDWESNKVIRPRAKIFATIGILLTFSLSAYFAPVAKVVKIILLIIGASILLFVLTRKSKID